jgi:hypothetical protein
MVVLGLSRNMGTNNIINGMQSNYHIKSSNGLYILHLHTDGILRAFNAPPSGTTTITDPPTFWDSYAIGSSSILTGTAYTIVSNPLLLIYSTLVKISYGYKIGTGSSATSANTSTGYLLQFSNNSKFTDLKRIVMEDNRNICFYDSKNNIIYETKTSLPSITSVASGNVVKCADNDTDIYRWYNNKLIKYTDTTLATGWKDILTSVSVYDCSGAYKSTGNMEKIPDDRTIIKCSDNKSYYTYLLSNNTIYNYESERIAIQYGGGTLPTNESNCDQYMKGENFNFYTQTIPSTFENGKALKCKDDNSLYRFFNQKIYKYNDTNIAQTWDSSYNNYSGYNCGTLTNTSTIYTNKPSDGQTVKCTDDKLLYRLSLSDNKLYKYETENVAKQYGGKLPLNETLCDFFTKVPFTSYTEMTTTSVTEGQAVKCDGKGTDVYRWMNGKLIKYPSNDTSVANSWDSSWNNYMIFKCNNVPISSGVMEAKKTASTTSTAGVMVKCSDDSKYYNYSYSDNKLYKYEDEKVAAQYGGTLPTAISNCDLYQKVDFTSFSQMPTTGVTEGQPIKCDGKGNDVYRWMNGKLIKYPDTTVANSWDPSWNNYKKYKCDNVTFSTGTMGSKPTNNQTIKIDSSYFRYTTNDGKLHKYETDNIAKQYGVTLPTIASNPDQFQIDVSFNDYVEMTTTSVTEGQAVKCYGKGDDVYRWMNGKLIKYADATIANSWDPSWNNYMGFKCNNVPISAGVMEAKKTASTTSTAGVMVKCSDDSKYYNYSYADNKLYKYEDEKVATQYGGTLPTAISNCDLYQKVDFTGFSQLQNANVTEGQSIKCDGKGNDVYRWTNGKLIKYPTDTDTAVANSWNPSWNNYLKYKCDNITFSTRNMDTKPANNETVKSSDGKYYRYNSAENKLYKYETSATAQQYGGNLPTTDKNLDMFVSPTLDFVPTQLVETNANEGDAVRCTSKDTANVYRWTNAKLLKYPSPDVAGSWDSNWSNFKSYNCDNKWPVSETMESRPSEGTVLKCSDNNKYYKYDRQGNTIVLYDNAAILSQYNVTTNPPSNTVNCNQFKSRDVFTPTQALSTATEGQALKCLNKDQNTVFRYTGGKLMRYPSESIAGSWDSNWLNYKAYDCGNTVSSGDMQARGGDGVTIKCSDVSGVYYRYNTNDNNLLEYETNTVATQYGGTLPSPSIDCNQYNIQRSKFADATSKISTIDTTSTIDPSKISNGQTVRCSDASGVYYRYNSDYDVLLKYPDSAIANSWNPNYLSDYRLYNCTGKDRTNNMDSKPADGSAIKCTDDSKLYKYNATTNSLSFYPNASTFKQYNPTWNNTIMEKNCKQYTKTRGKFTATSPLTTSANEGESVACNETNVDTASNNIYRYIKSNNVISSYNNDDKIGSSWNSNWRNYNSYLCSTNYTQNVTTLPIKHKSNDVIQCDDTNKWYVYTSEDNSITNYPSRTVIRQYFPNYDGETFTRENCNSYKLNSTINLQQTPVDNTTIRFQGEPDYHIYKDSKTHKYPNTDIAKLNDPDYVNTGNIPRNTLDKSLTNIGEPVKWPLDNYDIINCNTVGNYNADDIYAFKKSSNQNEVGTITKYPAQNIPSQKAILTDWIGNTTNKYYNCGTVFGKTETSTDTAIPTKSDLIRCDNRTDTKSYTTYNVNGTSSTNRNAVNSSSKYFKYNPNTDKLERYGNEDVLKSYYPNYLTTAKPFSDCYMLNRKEDDTVIMYPDPSNNKIIKCTNQSDGDFPYYKYDSANKKLNKYPVQNVAERVDSSYLTNVTNYNCSYINLNGPGSNINYLAPQGGTIVNCSNEAPSTFPYYYTDSSSNKLKKYPTEHVLKSWYSSYTPQSYDCKYVPVEKGTDMTYKPPLDATTINCSNKKSEDFPYYKYNAPNQSLNRYKDLTSLFTWAPWNTNLDTNSVVNVSSYDCNYLSQQYGSVIDNKPVSDNAYIYCSNETNTGGNQQLYVYNNLLIRPLNASAISSWNVSVQNVANCGTFTKGPPLYEYNMENLHSYMNDPFLEINRGGAKNYFVLNNLDNSCNLIPNNYTNLTNTQGDYDKYYSKDKYVQLYTDDACTVKASNNSTVEYSKVNNFNVGTLKYNSGQNAKYYKLTTSNER